MMAIRSNQLLLIKKKYTHTIGSLTVMAGTMVARPGSWGASLTKADDKGDGRQGGCGVG